MVNHSRTLFREAYDRGNLPVAIDHGSAGNRVCWKVDPSELDYHHYLPLFFDGIRDKEEPCAFLATRGCYDLLSKGTGRILPVLGQIILPIKAALNTRDPQLVTRALHLVQALLLSEKGIGPALVPFYRQILPTCNIMRTKEVVAPDRPDYGHKKSLSMSLLIQDTMELMEQTGGQNAFVNIKYMVPCYESCVIRP